MPEFDAWAAYYDLLHPGLSGEVEFYVGQALRLGGPVLEIGCGTGRIALPMAMSGLEVAGLDNSVPMLDVCREKAGYFEEADGRLTLLEGDMRDFDLGRQFPLVIMAYRTFMHCLETEEQLACLRCIHKHLLPGGALFCNLWAARPATIVHVGTQRQDTVDEIAATHDIPDEGLTLMHYAASRRDDFCQRLHERHRVQLLDETGAVVHEEELGMTRAWLTPREMEHLVARVGFNTEAVLGDFGGTPLGPEHTEMIWHLSKPS